MEVTYLDQLLNENNLEAIPNNVKKQMKKIKVDSLTEMLIDDAKYFSFRIQDSYRIIPKSTANQ